MLGPTRPLPRVGAQARIAHFGGGHERGTVIAVHDDGRRVDVLAQGGETLQFVLSPATARFVSAASGQGPRLELLGDGA
jgi:phage gp45-like